MAENNSIHRQPTKLDYASPTQFKFVINQLPKVEYFITAANVPSIANSNAIFPTPYKEIPVQGDQLTYDNLTIAFLVDEYLENYNSILDWLAGVGFPQDRSQFRDFRGSTSTTPIATQSSVSSLTAGKMPDVGIAEPSTSARSMYSDMTLTVLSNKNNPIVEIRFEDAFPVALGALEYNQNATDVEYMSVTADFKYKIFKVVALP